jgi:hypothetical protein
MLASLDYALGAGAFGHLLLHILPLAVFALFGPFGLGAVLGREPPAIRAGRDRVG